jgi:dynein regulatry complex protein 1
MWNKKLGRIISEKTYNVWKALYKGLTKYHDLLFERKKLIEETSDLFDRNKELKKLLKVYMKKDDNRALLIPPHMTIKTEKFNFALSELGTNSVQQ